MDKAEYLFEKLAGYSPEKIEQAINSRLDRIDNLGANTLAGGNLVLRTMLQSKNMPFSEKNLVRLNSRANVNGLNESFAAIMNDKGPEGFRRMTRTTEIPLEYPRDMLWFKYGVDPFKHDNILNPKPVVTPVVENVTIATNSAPKMTEAEKLDIRMKIEEELARSTEKVRKYEDLHASTTPEAIAAQALKERELAAAELQLQLESMAAKSTPKSSYGRYLAGMGVLGAGVGGTMIYKHNKKEI